MQAGPCALAEANMSTPNGHEPAPQPYGSEEDLIIDDDGPWDNTVRPARLSLVPYLLAVREQMAHPDRPWAEIMAEMSALPPAELERRRDELRKRGSEPGPSS